MLGLQLISLLSILLLADGSAAASNCFAQEGDSYTKPSDGPDRVSLGLVCPQSQSNKTCSIEGGGYVEVSSTLNITTAQSDIFGVLRSTLNQSFNTSVWGTVAKSNFTIDPGQSGFVAFTPIYLCYQGVLLGGCFKDVDAGTAVEACEPQTSTTEDEYPPLVGVSGFVMTDAQSAAKYTTNPAAAKPTTPAAANSTTSKGSPAYRTDGSEEWLAFATIGLAIALYSM